MSNVICNNCNQSNSADSKFCSNCGSRLPPSTQVMCPNCDTPNAKSLFYCDNCGTRLVKESLPTEVDSQTNIEDSPPSQPAHPLGDILSLPTRKPGHTGKIDLDELPDWLRTGERDHDELVDSDYPLKESPSKPLPRLEDLTPTTKGVTGDLPDWLVDEDDSSEIFEAPSEITTEVFRDMVGQEGPDSGVSDLFASDEADAAGEPDLPDWLSEAVQETGSLRPPPASEEEEEALPNPFETTTNIPDWLAELGGIQTGDLELPEEEEDLPDEMADMWDDSAFDEETPHWLSDLAPAAADEEQEEESAVLAVPDEFDTLFDSTTGLGEWGEPVTETGDLPDWLSELEPTQTDLLYEADTAASTETPVDDFDSLFEMEEAPATPRPEPMDDLPDWLRGGEEVAADLFPEADVAQSEAAADEFDSLFEMAEPPSAEVAPVETADELPDWLTDAEAPDLEAADDLTFEAESAVESTVNEVVTGWLSALDDSDEEMEAESAVESFDDFDFFLSDEADAQAGDVVTGWLADLDESDEDEIDDIDFEVVDDFEASFEMTDDVWGGEPPLTDTESAIAEEFPDWLSDLDEAADQEAMDQALPDWLRVTDEDEETAVEAVAGEFSHEVDTKLDWLTEVEPVETVEAELELPHAEAIDEAAAEEEEGFWEPDQLSVAEEPDWLSELDTFDSDHTVEGVLDVAAEADLMADLAQDMTPSPDEAVAERTADQMITADIPTDLPERITDSDFAFDDVPTDEELPEWLAQLGDVAANKKATDPLMENEDLPDWLNQMKPEEERLASSLPGMKSSLKASMPDNLQDIPEELAGADLPDWLDIPLSSIDGEPLADISPEFADILRFDTDEDEETASSRDLASLLRELPPPRDLTEDLAKAEIPEWVDALKPPELATGESPKPQQPMQETGPLAGIRGVIDEKASVSTPHATTMNLERQLLITPEQQHQITLLQQLAQSEAILAGMPTQKATRKTFTWSQPVFVILVFVVMILIIRWPGGDLLERERAVVPAAVANAYEAVMAVEGQPVLIAFDYTPSMRGELDVQAEMLVAQLEANGSPIITVSQYAAGTAVAVAQTSDQTQHVGFVPGDAVGLRQFSRCLTEVESCGMPFLDQQALADLPQVNLIIVLTSHRHSLINWIEQVGASQRDTALVVGITQSLEPVAAPYFASGQLTGTITRLAAAGSYPQLFTDFGADARSQRIGDAQLIVQLLLVAFFTAALLYKSGQAVWGRFRKPKQVSNLP